MVQCLFIQRVQDFRSFKFNAHDFFIDWNVMISLAVLPY